MKFLIVRITMILWIIQLYSVYSNVQLTKDTTKLNMYLNGFLDVYYVYDFNKPKTIARQPFLFNHNRHNEVNVNLAFLSLRIDEKKIKANFGIRTGTYVQDNYVNESTLSQFIHEANISLALNQKNNLWLTAGIMPSHIGFESAISIDQWTLTRSLLAENSPYYLAGSKITLIPSPKLEISALILNGWQRIQRLNGNSLPSFGTQCIYKPKQNITFNWSTFIGTDDPDITRRMRYFNNLYAQFRLNKILNILCGMDVGFQQTNKRSSTYYNWFSPVIISQINVSNSIKTSFRAEYYQDYNQIIIPVNDGNTFSTIGFSWNIDYSKNSNFLGRMEARWLNNKDRIFWSNNQPSYNHFFVSMSLAVKFSELLKQ